MSVGVDVDARGWEDAIEKVRISGRGANLSTASASHSKQLKSYDRLGHLE